jgi:type I restriction enzyme, S subunit
VDQTSAAGIRGRDLRRVHLPPLGLRAQAKAAEAMDALDRKAETAQATVDRLQAILDAEYDARFIRFVDQDAAAGRQSTQSAGWPRVSLSELVQPIRESGQPGREPTRMFRHYSIPAFDAAGRPEEVVGASMLSAKNVITGRHCLLVSKLNPETKRVWRVHEDGAMEAVASPEFVALVPKPGIPITFIEGLFRNDDDFYDRLAGRVRGTTTSRQRLRPADILAADCLLPPAGELSRWGAFAAPLSDRILLSRSQVRLVERMRHTLVSRFPWSMEDEPADGTDKQVTAEAA